MYYDNKFIILYGAIHLPIVAQIGDYILCRNGNASVINHIFLKKSIKNYKHINMKQSNQSSGIGFVSLLALSFIVLKLCSIITWTWWVVLLPLEIPFAICIICALIMILCVRYQDHKRYKQYNKPKKRK